MSSRFRLVGVRASGVTAALVASILMTALPARAQEAAEILRAMSSYVASQKTLSFAFDTEIEIVTPAVQKIQFASSGQVVVSRPDKVRVTRTGGYADVELVADGKSLILLGKNLNAYAQADLGGPIDTVVDALRSGGADLPAADLLSTDPFAALTDGVIEGKNIGRGVIDGVECHHLAFRNIDTDWQIWIQVGDQPIPRKYLITSKAVGAAPQYAIRIKDWKTNPTIAADAFAFKAPEGAKKVEIKALSNFDEIPSSAAFQ